MTDWLIKGLLGTLVLATLFLLFVVLPEDMERSARAKQLADDMGCTYIGSARDLNSVKFFQCGDDIVLKRVR